MGEGESEGREREREGKEEKGRERKERDKRKIGKEKGEGFYFYVLYLSQSSFLLDYYFFLIEKVLPEVICPKMDGEDYSLIQLQ